MSDRAVERKIAEVLHNNGFPSAGFEARQMVLSAKTETEAMQFLERRLRHEPLQYILGEWEFYGLPFSVGPGVLIPRPDTEVVVETAIKLLNGQSNMRVLDICSGSGCIGIALGVHCNAEVTLLEKSPDALRFLRDNLKCNHIDATVLECDVLEDGLSVAGQDLIISNPPYIKTSVLPSLEREVKCEPKMALDGGEDGLVFYRRITELARSSLKSGGYLVFEIGFDQRDEVMAIFRRNGFEDITCVKDYGGNDRVVFGKMI
ncbi:MAG: peptide chain release factor N(5)-glutamine methyltransferase [Ruminococcaceae bacterium]|nr:peptide chain release factor N(5)-glutamine methyltransferase [Oscillospiraceae bacterium]